MADDQTTTQTSQSASPAVQATVDKLATGLGNEYAPGKSLYQAPSSATQQGIQGLLDTAGNQTYGAGVSGALDLTSDVAAGNRFGENDAYYKTLMNDAIEGANKPFLSSGTYGSDKHRQAVATGLARVQGEQFNSDVARQERAQANLPGLLNASSLPSQMRLTGGGLLDADAAAKAAAPTDYLAKHSSILAGNAGTAGTTTTKTEPMTPWWQSAAGIGFGLL
jgi:hypothetical protein